MEKEKHRWEKYVFQEHIQNIKINEYFDRRNKTNNFLIWLTFILLWKNQIFSSLLFHRFPSLNILEIKNWYIWRPLLLLNYF